MSDTAALSSALLSGRYRALAKAISLVERDDPAAPRLLAEIYPATGQARIIGITGSPGSGKSTLVAALARHYRAHSKRVGIIAVDPTSPFTGGAILGDRIRMADLYTDRGVFIRSMATRGFLGGLARATNDVVDVLDASGFDIVLVETVGVGQDEIEVVRTVQTNLVVLVPGMGDDIQAIKAGIMEIADVFVINKADREGVERVERELHVLLTMAGGSPAWVPPVVKTVAPRGEGVPDLLSAVEGHRAFLKSGAGAGERLRLKHSQKFRDLLAERFLMELSARHLTPEREEALLSSIVRREADPYSAAEEILGRIRWEGKP